MDGFTLKSFTTSQPRSYTYSYYVYNPAAASGTPATKPALLLCHGYPDEALLWANIVPALKSLGHPIVVPDMLGYGGTSKPTDPNEYNSKLITQDLYELADAENFDKIIPVGHDWGAYVASRLYIWRPDRCAGLILLSVAYQPPAGTPFNLAATLDFTEKIFGYPNLAYWELFAADDGPAVIRQNMETYFHLLHWDDPDAMLKVFCTRGATRKMVTEMKAEDIPLKPYAQQPGFKDAFIKRMTRDGFEGPQCYYQVVTKNFQHEAEKEIPKENFLVKVPCLYIGSTGDKVCRTDGMERVKDLVPDVEIHVVEANHWCSYEKPEEVRGYMAEWLKTRFTS